jgi:hypothetical protein
MANAMLKIKKRKKLLLLLVIVLYFFLPVPSSRKQTANIQSVIIQKIYEDEDYGHKEKLKTCYIMAWEGEMRDEHKEFDPSPATFQKLQVMPKVVKPVSQLQIPDKSIGTQSMVFGVTAVRRSLGLAYCRGCYDGGGLCSSEFLTLSIWTPFGWKPIVFFRLWVS